MTDLKLEIDADNIKRTIDSLLEKIEELEQELNRANTTIESLQKGIKKIHEYNEKIQEELDELL